MGCCVGKESNSSSSSSTSPPWWRRHSAHVGVHHDDDGPTHRLEELATAADVERPPVQTIPNTTSARRPVVARNPLSVESLHDDDAVVLRSTTRTNADVAEPQSSPNHAHYSQVVAVPLATTTATERTHDPVASSPFRSTPNVAVLQPSTPTAQVVATQGFASPRPTPPVLECVGIEAVTCADAIGTARNTTKAMPTGIPFIKWNHALRTCVPRRCVEGQDEHNHMATPAVVLTQVQSRSAQCRWPGADAGDQGADASQPPTPPFAAFSQQEVPLAPLYASAATSAGHPTSGGDDEQSLVVDRRDDDNKNNAQKCNLNNEGRTDAVAMYNAAGGGNDVSVAAGSILESLPVVHCQRALAADGERDVLHDQQTRRPSSSLSSRRSLSWNPQQFEEFVEPSIDTLRRAEGEAQLAGGSDSAEHPPHRTREGSCSSRPSTRSSSLSTRDDLPLEPSLHWTSTKSSGSIFLCDHNAPDTNMDLFEAEATELPMLERRSSEGEVSKILNDEDSPHCAVMNSSSVFQKSSQTSSAASAKRGVESAHLEDVALSAQRVVTPIPSHRCGAGAGAHTGPVDSVLSGEEGGSMSVSVAPDPSLAPTAAAYDDTWARSSAGASFPSSNREELLEVAI